MSAEFVHNAILKTIRGNTTLSNDFSGALTGTASSTGAAVTGTSTLFTTELAVGKYIGTPTKGFRKITVITDNTHLTVESAFDTALSGDTIKVSNIFKGMPRNLDITKVGKAVSVVFRASTDIPVEEGRAPVGMRVRAMYGFSVVVAFFDPDDERAEQRKSEYDQLLRNIVDNNMNFGEPTIIANTSVGDSMSVQHPDLESLYYLTMPVVCFKTETMGSR
jgi:hypothetical protein